MGLRITTWNVNGIRNPFSYQPWSAERTFQSMFDTLQADIVILQELKIQQKDLRDDMVLIPGWDAFLSLPKQKKGYSGVAIYTRSSKCAPIRAEEGITGMLTAPKTNTRYRDLPPCQQIGGYPEPEQLSGIVDEISLDSEGRCVILEFPAFVLLGVYSPANRDDSRDDFRIGFLQALEARVRNLVAGGKEVILAGDLNVARSELDMTNIAEVVKKKGMTMEDWLNMPARRLFNGLVFDGDRCDPGSDSGGPILCDLARTFHPKRQGMNTVWDTKKNTRPANFGSRIDYVLCSTALKDWFESSDIQEGLMGSDHCPVFAIMRETILRNKQSIPLASIINPPDMFDNHTRQRPWHHSDHPPLSAKLIPEFDRRQNIREMFSRLPAATAYSNLRASTKNTSAIATETGLSQKVGETGASSTRWSSADNVADVPKSSSPKRPPKPLNVESRSKKPRLIPNPQPKDKSKPPSNQRTLQSYFKRPQPLEPQTTPDCSGATHAAASSSEDFLARVNLAEGPAAIPPATTVPAADQVFDPIQSKESWSKLLGKRFAPKCEHHEPCISLTTKKPGVNCGRSFYICPRPLGPSGEKETGSEWRCGTFIWSSDWKEGKQ